MKILGISAFYHDSAACLVVDGKVIAAAQEERFTRKKHDSDFPVSAIRYCLGEANLQGSEIDYVAYYEKPFLKFERLLETYLSEAPRGFGSFRKGFPIWIKEKLFQKKLLCEKLEEVAPKIDWSKKLLFGEHHQSHAASAFFPSPFENAAVLTMDGTGEWATTSVAIGSGSQLEIQKEIHFPHSLGLLYSAFTHFLGFKVNSGEYKVMGLAPYGNPRFRDMILKNLIELRPDGSFHLNMEYFEYCTGLQMTGHKFSALFGANARKSDEPLTQFHMDIAASIQEILNESVLAITRSIHHEFKIDNLCLSGGVALNCVTNGKVLQDGRFKRIWIQPAAGDSGGAVGAALGAYHIFLNQPRRISESDGMSGSFLGPSYSASSIEEGLRRIGAVFTKLKPADLLEETAKALSKGEAVAWFQGRMEFGPRALGARSILADPRPPDMQKKLNQKIKFREDFRPFAPAVLRECAVEWFDLDIPSPYMLFITQLKASKRSLVPAVTHVDFSARVQTVEEDANPRLYQLLNAFRRITGCPILLNTSFNVRGEPIVCSPTDAFHCFMGTDLDRLVIDDFMLIKEDQDSRLLSNYKSNFDPD